MSQKFNKALPFLMRIFQQNFYGLLA